MAFIHPRAVVLGSVKLGSRASVWPCAVLRGDTDHITVGDESNIQDGAVVHVDEGVPCSIGARVTVGHRAIVHGATIEDDCLIGMGAVIMNGVVVGTGSIVAAGAVLPEGMEVPSGSVVMGVPAKVVRQVDDAGRKKIARGARAYVELQQRHANGEFPPSAGE